MAAGESSSGKGWGRRFDPALVEAVLEASPSGILIVDENDAILANNLRLFEVFDIDPTELFGEGSHDLSGWPDNPMLSAVLDRVQNPG